MKKAEIISKILSLADLSSFEDLPAHIQKVLMKIGWDKHLVSISEAPKRYAVYVKFGLIDKADLKVLVKEPSFMHVVMSKPFTIGLLFKK